jgi:murein L,D-transpeptidase YcbB/YkuD
LIGCSGNPQKPSTQQVPTTRSLNTSEEISIDTNTTPPFVANNEASANLWKATQRVYALRQFRPAFLSKDHLNANADAVLQTLRNASSEGLHPDDFGISELERRRTTIDTADTKMKNDFELQLTYELGHYVSQLCFGRIDPRQVDPAWPPIQKICDIPQLVNDALEHNAVAKLAEQLSPKIPEYRGLRAALQRYRDVAGSGGWQPLARESTPKKSDKRAQQTAPTSTSLPSNLEQTGDLENSNTAQPIAAADVKAALKKFQARHGLEITGALNPKTIAAMNIPVDKRIDQIEINLDRMRWIGDRLEPLHLRVNIPGFEVSVHDGEQMPLKMRVIVGSKENPTPVLDGQMEYLVFSPYWNIPLSIATKEIVPKIRKDPNFLRKEEMEVIRVSGNSVQTVDPSKIDWDKVEEGSGYQLRQRPGSSNALGLVKFIFPNRYNVYLHDTPADNLFDRLTRTLSHGCVRVERPTDLATYVLRDQPEWTPQRIEEAMHSGKEKKVSLKKPLPVHLVYWTAWAEPNGTVQFRDDVYGYDDIHRGLVSAPARLPTANAANVDVNEIGTRIVPNAADPHR